MKTRALCSLAALPLLWGCATLAEPAGGDQNLPSADVGPFRPLSGATPLAGDAGTGSEIGNSLVAPYGIDDFSSYSRDIAVLDADGDPTTLAVVGYVASAAPGFARATDPTKQIVRYDALDGRSFDRMGEVVLTPDAAWEGGIMTSPAAVRSGGETLLYYAAAGGIGLAKSADGHVFVKAPGPVLGPAAGGGWERGALPASPGVVQLADGSFRMFYEVAIGAGVTAIGEATSADGAAWTRVGSGPALAPSGGGDAGPTPWDATSVGSPFPMVATSSLGRPILRVFYGAVDVAGNGTIGLAARFGTDGPLERAVSPVFGTSGTLDPREPCVVVFSDFTLLYATEASASTDPSPGVAVGVAPATAVLPAPVSSMPASP